MDWLAWLHTVAYGDRSTIRILPCELEESIREFVAFAWETEEIQVEMSEEDTGSKVKSVEELQAQVNHG